MSAPHERRAMMDFLTLVDEKGREWVVDLETRRAIPAITGGCPDAGPFSEERCSRHETCELVPLAGNELERDFGATNIRYCPLLECQFIKFRHRPPCHCVSPEHSELLAKVAVGQAVFFHKLIRRLVDDGK